MYLIRHSERLDYVNKDKWKKSKRYLENPRETPISKNGISIAKDTILNIMDNDNRDIEYIYSSPSERCVQTSIEFQKQILKKKKTFIPIKIENGLLYYQPYCLSPKTTFEFGKNKIFIDNTNNLLIDDFMKLPQIYKRYKNKIDTNYSPLYSDEQINSEYNNCEKLINILIKTLYNINKNSNNNKLNIVCSHGENLQILYLYSSKINNMLELNNFWASNFTYDDFCYWIKYNKMIISHYKNKNGLYNITHH
jgi:hypothetical protein